MPENARILIVDDEPKICQFLEVLLRREGYEPVSVYNGQAALDKIEQDGFDMVITDLKMPGMDGFQLVQELKSRKAELPVIMVTGYATIETAVKALRIGVEDYVTKPFNVDELRKVISHTLDSRRMVAENRELVGLLEQVRNQLAQHNSILAQKVEDATAAATGNEQRKPSLPGKGAHAAIRNGLDAELKCLLDRITTELDARASSIMIKVGNVLELRTCEGDRMRDLIGTRLPLSRGIAGYVAREKKPLLVRGVEDRLELPASDAKIYETASFICVPILHEEEVLGVISVGEKRDKSAFTDNDLKRVCEAAKEAAPALRHAAELYATESHCRHVLETLADAYESKGRYLCNHSQRVADYATALARACDASADEIEVLRHAAQLHDIGKMSLSEYLLDKKDELSDKEKYLVRKHPVIGERIVEGIKSLQPALPVIRHHHERVDGRGYPDGLKGSGIPRLARILAIADAFDAMTSDRPYRRPLRPDDAVKEILAGSGLQFDPELATLFCSKVVDRDN